MTGISGETKADTVPWALAEGRSSVDSARTGDTCGLSEIGVGGNDLFRSNGFRIYKEYISAFRFEVAIEALSISISFRRAEADITVSLQSAPSDDAKLGQLFLADFVEAKIR